MESKLNGHDRWEYLANLSSLFQTKAALRISEALLNVELSIIHINYITKLITIFHWQLTEHTPGFHHTIFAQVWADIS